MNLPEEKRPSTKLIWEGTPEELKDWIDRALEKKEKGRPDELELVVPESQIEG